MLGFWIQNYNDRRAWIRSKVIETELNRMRKVKKGDIDRKMRVYHFENEDGERAVVCQQFFLSTLGFLKDCVIKTAIMSDKRIVPAKDKRGADPAINKIGPEIEEKVRTYFQIWSIHYSL